MHAAGQIFIVQRRTRRKPGHSHIADDIALLHTRAHVHIARETRHVAVKGGNVCAVRQDDCVAVSATLPLKTDVAVAGRVHGRAGGRRIVRAHMATDPAEYRVMTVWGEWRTSPGEFHGRAQEPFSHRGAAWRVVAGIAVVADKTYRPIHLAFVDELRCQHFAVAKIFAVLKNLFVLGRKTVAFADVEHKVDIPAKYIGEFEGHHVRDVGGAGGLKQRGIDDGIGGADPHLDRVVDHLYFEAALLPHDIERLCLADFAPKLLNIAIGV